MGSKAVCIPKLDFSRLQSGNSAAWDALQGEMMHALESYGAFEVVYGTYISELRGALFDRALPELFGLPPEKKIILKNDTAGDGYVGQSADWRYESLRVPDEVDKFTRMLWPEGYLTFSDTVATFTGHMKELEQIIARMLFLALGVEKFYESYAESSVHAIFVAEYGTSRDPEIKTGIGAHVDNTNFTIICQKEEGLEIQNRELEWIPVVSSPNSFTVLVGESIQAWTNGRLQAPVHRVRITGNRKRYSAVFASTPKDDCIVQTPKELVDEGHPLIYKPYVFKDHKIFLYFDDGFVTGRTLKDFCGIREGGAATISVEDSEK